MANQEECIHINATERSPSSQHISPLSPSSPSPDPWASPSCSLSTFPFMPLSLVNIEDLSARAISVLLELFGCSCFKRRLWGVLVRKKRIIMNCCGLRGIERDRMVDFFFSFFWDVSREMFERMIDFRLYKLLFCLY